MEEIEFIGKCLLIKHDKKKILVIGDLHLGYEGALRESGVFIGSKMFGEYKTYLEGVFEKIGWVEEIILLGDVKHVIGTVIDQEWNEVLGFLDYLESKCDKIIIIRGQHDVILEPILRKRKKVRLLESYISGKFGFVHGERRIEEIEKKEIKHWVMGNGHPAIRISDGIKTEKYKCFLVGQYKGKEVIICPSFIEANEGTDPREYDLGMGWVFDYNKFEVMVVNDGLKDLDFGKLGKIR